MINLQRIGSLPKKGSLGPLPLLFNQEQLQEVEAVKYLGKTKGLLTCIQYGPEKTACGRNKLFCRCECGNHKWVNISDFSTKSKTMSCGCYKFSLKQRLNHFHNKYTKKDNGCWIWNGSTANGYGRFCLHGKEIKAHRFAYEQFIGEIPEGFFVCHTCDNPSCVNPEHLFVGTPSENSRDMVKKGRSLMGSKNPNSKINPDDVKKIIALHCDGMSPLSIAKIFGLSDVMVRNITKGKNWKHVS